MTLSSIQTSHQKIGLVELDLAPQLADLLGLDLNLEENVKVVQSLLLKMGKICSAHVTGLVVDPIFGFEISKNSGQAGVLTRLNTLQGSIDPQAVPSLIPNYGLEEMRNNYNLAAFELHYHPQEENALHKKQLLAEIFDYCDYLDMDLLVNLTIYSPTEQKLSSEEFQQHQLQAVQELRGSTSLLALQYPLDPLATATITAELDIPWIVRSQQQTYEEFKQELRICLENGALGFSIGTSLFAEMSKLKLEDKSPDLDKINQFCNTTFQDRVIELMRITQDS